MADTLCPMIEKQREFLASLAVPFGGDEAFDGILDTVYFVKDDKGRYVFVNQTLVTRCGLKEKSQLLNRTVAEVFPSPLGEDFEAQDRAILAGGAAIRSKLELHIYPEGRKGWCLTWKSPLRGKDGKIAGISGISRDIDDLVANPKDLESVATVMTFVREHLDEPLKLSDLAKAAGVSSYQISQRMKKFLSLSPRQYINRCRIDAAYHLLECTENSLTDIALSCGFSDQSSFTKQFGRMVGSTPKIYRDDKRKGGKAG